MNSRNWRKTHSELQLKRSSSNSSMPKCLPTWRNHLTRRIWELARMKRLCRILKGSWNWMVWKPQTKCHFGVRQVEFLGRTISPDGISPQARKIQNFLDKLRFPKSKKHYSGIWVSWTTTEIIFPDWLKNLIRSTNCLKRKCQSILHQNWKEHLIRSTKLSVMLEN